MSAHIGSSVNVIEEADNPYIIIRVEGVRTPIVVIGEQLRKDGMILTEHVDDEICISTSENNESLKSCMQELINQAVIQIGWLSKKEEEVTVLEIPYPTLKVQIPVIPLVIQVHSPFLYKIMKAIHWVYEPKKYKHMHVNQPLIINEPNVTSIVGPEE